MLEMPINQATGLIGLGASVGSHLLTVVSHGDARAELPLLWQLCSSLVELGYPVTVLDGTEVETVENPGLAQLLDYRYGIRNHGNDALEWNVLPSAAGVQDLCSARVPRGHRLHALSDLFEANSIVILYAKAEMLVELVGGSKIQPLLAVSSGKNALLTSYLALKRLLLNGKLSPEILTMMPSDRSKPTGTSPGTAQHLSDCARNFLGYEVSAMHLDPTAPDKEHKASIRHLATRLLETAFPLLPDRGQEMYHRPTFDQPLFAGLQ